jgi:inositol oxygenase
MSASPISGAVAPVEAAPDALLVAAETAATAKPAAAFRNYEDSARHEKVQAFYKEQHEKMTFEFVEAQEKKYLGLDHFKLGVWEALEYLDSLVDDSDPDTDLSQTQHALQTAEAIRAKYPDDDWFHLTGLIHDLGKILAIACKEPQWATVGDSFPVGCAFAKENVFSQFFAANPDSTHPVYSTSNGVYTPGCGLSKVKMSWGHDEYLYQVCVRNGCTLPIQALYMIRFHSFYPWHNKGAYVHLTDAADQANLEWVLKFNQHDLYSKANEKQDVEKLKPYYQSLIQKYFPAELKW